MFVAFTIDFVKLQILMTLGTHKNFINTKGSQNSEWS